MFHGWMFDPDGDQAAADSTRSSTSLDTGSSVNPRTARRLVTASYTSMIAYLLLIGFFSPDLVSTRAGDDGTQARTGLSHSKRQLAPAGEISGCTSDATSSSCL